MRRPGYRYPPPISWRLAVQVLTLLVVLGIGWQFADWVHRLQQGLPGGVRPPGVEGFLPISALISLRAWLLTGPWIDHENVPGERTIPCRVQFVPLSVE